MRVYAEEHVLVLRFLKEAAARTDIMMICGMGGFCFHLKNQNKTIRFFSHSLSPRKESL